MRSKHAVLALWIGLGLAAGGAPLRADEGPASAEDRIVEVLPLDGIPAEERDRIVETVHKLIRIHRTAGDPSGGEVESYQEAVEDLARYLKRETVEDRRRLTREAAAAMRDLVDRDWIDRAFQSAREGSFPNTEVNLSMLDQQIAGLRTVGELLKQEQEIVVRQKALASSSERRYREMLRLGQEGDRLLESIGRPAIQAALEWMTADIDHAFEESVRPAHDRQVRLLSLYQKVTAELGQGPGTTVVKVYREYASKVRVIARQLGRPGPGDSN